MSKYVQNNVNKKKAQLFGHVPLAVLRDHHSMFTTPANHSFRILHVTLLEAFKIRFLIPLMKCLKKDF